jgi:hypothetical protein
MRGRAGTEKLRKAALNPNWNSKASPARTAMVQVVNAVDRDRIPADAVRLNRWLADATEVLA